jgi:hypothetical protein
LKYLEEVLKLANFNMENNIEFFKVEKLASYYMALKQMAEIQKGNSSKLFDFWATVAKDKNISKLTNQYD